MWHYCVEYNLFAKKNCIRIEILQIFFIFFFSIFLFKKKSKLLIYFFAFKHLKMQFRLMIRCCLFFKRKTIINCMVGALVVIWT